MIKYDLKVKYKDTYKPNYMKKCIENIKPNLIERDFNANRLNQKWSTDITYLIYNGKELIFHRLWIYIQEISLLIK